MDANYKFIYIDIGCNRRKSDGGVFRNCDLYKELEENRLNIPQSTFIPGMDLAFPYVIVADDAFLLKQYILKPYSQTGLTRKRRIFNYRLSRAHCVVENALGILANQFRVFMTPITLVPETVETITMACCTLHNFLRSRPEACSVYTPPGSLDTKDPVTQRCDKETAITNHLQQVYSL